MATVKLYDLIPSGQSFDNFYTTIDIKHASGTKAEFVEDGGDGNRIIIEGRNLSYNGVTLTGGTIFKVTFENAEGAPYAVVSDLHLRASKLEEDQNGHLSARDMDFVLLAGNDTIRGTGHSNSFFERDGDDRVFGGAGSDIFYNSVGNDTYTGGAGGDRFIVGPHPGPSYGHDVITDFDPSGPHHDRLLAENNDVTITKFGDGTLVTFDSDTSVLLEGVKPHDFSADDIVIII